MCLGGCSWRELKKIKTTTTASGVTVTAMLVLSEHAAFLPGGADGLCGAGGAQLRQPDGAGRRQLLHAAGVHPARHLPHERL